MSAAKGNKVLEFRVVSGTVNDQSVNPATNPAFYAVPAREQEDKRRCFKFDRENGQWVINDEVFDCDDVRFKVKRNDTEVWKLEGGFNWQHPIHIHFEEHQIIKRNGQTPTLIERGRKDVVKAGREPRCRDLLPFPGLCRALPDALPQHDSRGPRDDAEVGHR